MADDQHVVFGDGEIELQRRDAERKRRLECRERILWREPACAAMALQVEGESIVSVRGDAIRFAFRGKSGRMHEVEVEDPRVARTLRRCRELPGQLLFQYMDRGKPHKLTSSDINDYLRDAMGEEFTAKDFRTWSASVIVARELFDPAIGTPPSPREAIRIAADELGNTPAVCQRAYVHPAVLEAAAEPLANQRVRALFARTTRARDGLDRHELALLRYLRSRT